MAWTTPTRYPNSMEIADNEAFLNTNVIDNLVDHETRIANVGLVLTGSADFTAQTSVSIDNCFSSSYKNYRAVIHSTFSSATANLFFRWRVGGVDNSTASSYLRQYAAASAGVFSGGRGSNAEGVLGLLGAQAATLIIADIGSPEVATTTTLQSKSCVNEVAGMSIRWEATNHNQNTAYDGITVYCSGGTITGNLRIYGYNVEVA